MAVTGSTTKFHRALHSRRTDLTIVLSIGALYAGSRLSRLLALPIFNDESVTLNWAHEVRLGNWWISLMDPKPPLTYWLFAAVDGWTIDPLLAPRLVSVILGVLLIPV